MKRFDVAAAAFCILGVALIVGVVGPDTSAAESKVEIGKVGNDFETEGWPWCDKDNEYAVTNTIVPLPVTGRARGSSPISGTLNVTGNGLYRCPQHYGGPYITWNNFFADPTVTFPASSEFQPLGSFGVRLLCNTSDIYYSEDFYVLVRGIDDTGQPSSAKDCKIGMVPELVHLRVSELKVDRVNKKVTMKWEKTGGRVRILPWRIIAMKRDPLSSGGVTELGSGYKYELLMGDNTFEVTVDLRLLGIGDYIITGSVGPDVPGWNTSEHMNGIRSVYLSNYRPAPSPQGSTVPRASLKPFLVGGQYDETGLKFSLRYTVCNVEEGIIHVVNCDRFGCGAGFNWRNLDDMSYSSPRGGDLQPPCPGNFASRPGVVEIAEGFRPARLPGDCEPVRYQITVTADPDGRAEQSEPLSFLVSPVGCNLPQELIPPPPPDNPFPPFPHP